MAQIKNLIAKWGAAWPSPMIISRQYDNGQYRIDLFNYPEPEHIVDEQTEQMEVLSYYLIVWMKETEDGEPREMSPIQLPGPYWIVPNYYTQLVQDIRFQFCVQSDSTDYEAHSAIFTGRIVDSIEHDGDPVDVTPAEMFDAYKAYVNDLIVAAGDVQIDTSLSVSGAAADAKAVGDALSSTNERLLNQEELYNKLTPLFDETQETIRPTAHSGYRWVYKTTELVEHSTMTAWEFNADPSTTYILQGLSVGTSKTAAVLFVDSSDNIIAEVSDDTQETGHKLKIITPPNCAKVLYSTNTNATWDASPIKIAYISIDDSIAPVEAKADANRMFALTGKLSFNTTWGQGQIGLNGVITSGFSDRCYSVEYLGGLDADATVYIENPNGYTLNARVYDNTKEITGSVSGITNGYVLAAGCYLRFNAILSGGTLPPEDVDVSIGILSELVPGTDKGLQSYYYNNDWLETKLSEIRAQARVLNGVSFPFVTDMHFPSNSMQSKFLIKEILDHSSIPFALCGGDFPGAYGSRDDLYESADELIDYINTVGKDRFFCVRGNHDFTIKTDSNQTTQATGSGATLPTAVAYDAITRPSEFYVETVESGKFYYLIDIPASKTRIFMLSSCDTQEESDSTKSWAVYTTVSSEQVAWLIEKMQEKDGWHYIFVSHISPVPGISAYVSTQAVFHQIEAALTNHTTYNGVDFSQSTNEVICHICGHNHKDESHVDDGVLTISTTSDAHYSDGGWNRSTGSVNEQAIDVFTFNYDTREIKAKRVGGGQDRQWTY